MSEDFHLIYFCLEEAREWVLLLHQKQGNKPIREFHGIQETRVATDETAIRMKENLRIRGRQQAMLPLIKTEGFGG